MHAFAALIFVCLFVICCGHGVNYCGAKMCGYTNAHTLCQFVDASPTCTALLVSSLSASEKALILARLNRRRNDVASGKIPGLPSAGNMLKLRWVEELAREAQLWASQCRPVRVPEEHDACRDLYSINVGQCVASVVGESPGMKIESLVDIWFMQNKHFKRNVTFYEPPEPNKHYYGDFAQMMWARTFMVGCGRSRFLSPMNGRPRTVERLVCNFAPQGPTPYRPLWTPSVPATACPSRSRPCRSLTSLCDYPETASELQAALDRMEHEAANVSSTRKTRRQVEEYPDSGPNENFVSEEVFITDNAKYTLLTDITTDTIQDGNTSVETPAVLNMMLKYMPYLKNYKNEIMESTAQNSARCLCPSIVVMIGALRVLKSV